MNKEKRGEFFEAKFSLREENGIQIIFFFLLVFQLIVFFTHRL